MTAPRGSSRLPIQAYAPQSHPNLPRIEPPCVAFSPYARPVQGHKRLRSMYFSPLHFSPATIDLMKTIDLRYGDRTPARRSSLDLSDIFEEDEVELDGADILPPPTSTNASSTSTFNSTYALSIVGRKLKDIFSTVKQANFMSCIRPYRREAGPSAVMNDGTKAGLDLLA